MASKRWAKQKGSNAERELIKKFWETNEWVAHRMAGSGCSPYPGPDLIAGNGTRFLAIEVKATSETKRYFPKPDIEQLRIFSQKFGSECWLAVKFPKQTWLFLGLEDLRETDACFVAELEHAKTKGLTFKEVTEGF